MKFLESTTVKSNIMLRQIFNHKFIFIAAILLILICSNSLQIHAKKSEDLTTDVVLLGLDGISYDVMTEMYNGGYFRSFHAPIPMIATFPSISDPNWAQLVNVPPEESYTKAHFYMKYQDSHGIGHEVGNVLKHLTSPPEYEKRFDYKAENFVEHFASVALMKESAQYWIDDLEKHLLEQTKPQSFRSAFIFSTDLLSHTSGKAEIIKYLKLVDEKLTDIQKKYVQKFSHKLDYIIVSDHGNYYTKPKHIDFKTPLEDAGWKWQTALNKPTDFAFVAPEIISFGAFYVLPGSEVKFATDISKVTGVHVALAVAKPNVIRVYYSTDQKSDQKSDQKTENITEITIDPDKQTVPMRLLRGKIPFIKLHCLKIKNLFRGMPIFKKLLITNFPTP